MSQWRDPDARIVLFARAPVPGKVMTRLIPALGAQGACELHQLLLRRILLVLRAQSLAPVELWLDAPAAPETLPPHPFPLYLQSGEDLGARMSGACAEVLQRAQRVILVGTDCPGLDADYLQQALEQLAAGRQLVLGPAKDGGYVLIGMNGAYSTLFAGPEWGSDRVLEQTLETARREGLDYSLLPALADLDRPEDLALLEQHMEHMEYMQHQDGTAG